MRFRTVGMLAVVALVVASCGGGTPEAAGPSEGIQVHGDWTIDVLNADGSLDERVEFRNDLSLAGEEVLADALVRAATPGLWVVRANGIVTPCGSSCVIDESTGDLTVSASAGVITLTGEFVADVDGDIRTVTTLIRTCLPSTAPDACTSTPGLKEFTQKDLSENSVDVSAGQTVQIQVDISFTSG